MKVAIGHAAYLGFAVQALGFPRTELVNLYETAIAVLGIEKIICGRASNSRITASALGHCRKKSR